MSRSLPPDQESNLGGTCLLVEIDSERLATITPHSHILERPSLARNATLTLLGREIYREFISEDACSPLAVDGLVLETIAEASRAVCDGLNSPSRVVCAEPSS